MNRYLKISLKIIAWIVGSIIGLVLIVFILLQIPAIQNFAKGKVVTYIESKIKTTVRIEKLELALPKKLVLSGVYFESQEKDTLLAGERLAVDISLFKLLKNKVEINEIDLRGITANVVRNQDSVFNFDYIIDAFASEQQKEPKPEDTTSTMKFSIDKINLDRIKIKFDDAISKNDLSFYIGHFDTRIKKFDLDSMDFNIPKFTLSGLNLKLKQGLLEEVVNKSAEVKREVIDKGPSLKINLGEVELSKISLAYDNEGTKLDTRLELGKLLIAFNKIDLDKQFIDIKNLDLKDLNGNLVLGKIKQQPANQTTTASKDTIESMGWRAILNKADIVNVNFKFDDLNAKPTAKGVDYMHMGLSDVNLSAENFYYSTDTISGNILSFNAREKSGLNIEEFKTDFFYGPKSAELKDLYLKTPRTLLKDNIKISYPSIASITENLGELGLDATLKGSQLGFRDILLLAPDLAQTNPFKSNPNAVLKINSKMSGKVKDLKIPNLELSGIGTTKIVASGHITGLPDIDKAYFDLRIKNFQSSAKDLYGFVPANTIPNTISLPNYMNLKGIFKGSINNFTTDLNLVTSYGNAKLKANFDQRIKSKERYKAYALAQGLDVGKFLKNDSIGKVSFVANVDGVGLDPKTANAKIDATLNSAVYNQYVYKDLKLVGNIKNGLFEAKANMDDPNLDFNLNASGSFKGKYPSVKMNMVLDSADFNKLNLYAGSLRLRMNMRADIETADPDYLNGRIILNKILIAQEKEKFILDSIYVRAKSDDTSNTVLLLSPFLQAKVNGKYKLTELAEALSNSVAKYYDANPAQKKKEVGKQYFDFSARLNGHPFLFQFMPDLKKLDPVVLKGRYNSEGDSISLEGTIPRVVYGTNEIDEGSLKISTQNDALNYSLLVKEIKSGSVILPKTSLSGTVKNNILGYQLAVQDNTNKERYLIGGNVAAKNNNTVISLDPKKLKLNYDTWTVPEGNRIEIGKGIFAKDFILVNKGQEISIESQGETEESPLEVDFKKFRIETLTSIIDQDSLKIGGVIDGNVLLSDLTSNMVFTSDVRVSDFNFRGDTLGNIEVKVDNKQANTFTADVAITGNGNQANLNGIYSTANSTMDMALVIQKLNLASIQGFSFGNMKNASGYLSGDFKISGTASAPRVLGELKFNDGAFTLTQTNTYFKSLNDKIEFTDEGVVFNRFKLTDSTNNAITVNGKVLTKTYTDFKFDLTVNTSNFKVVGSTAKDNDLFYGDLFIDTRLKISGNMESPVVDGTLKVNKGTQFTVVLPTSDPNIAEREGIVEFIDQDNMDLNQVFVLPDTLENTQLKGMNVSVNIEIDKEAVLTMIIDKGNGDFVKVQGDAQLSGGIDPSGKVSLTGRYELNEGSYEMTFNFINRKFDIQKGSSIIWTGEPMSAIVDITAVYVANTAPLNLLEDQLVEESEAVKNTYKQKVPFQVLLNMDGELLKPEITFDIKLPDGNYNVSSDIISNSQNKLDQLRQQPSELNKQVFALLLLNRFIGENPFANDAGGGGVSSMVRQSVSKILSEQLNNLAGNLIEGVELNFDLESTEDYSTGSMENRTDLNIGVSKRFLDDRLKVTVGSNFGLEGTNQPNRETNNIAGDIAVDYKLSADGRYMLRAYRKNQYEVALQGQVIETGVGFILTMDYNKFKEIFEDSRERRQTRVRNRQEREREK